MRDDAEQFTSDERTPDERTAPEPVRHERVLDLAPDLAWQLLETSEGLERWLGDEVDLTVAPGETGTIRDGDEVLVTEVESVEPGRRVSLRWWSEERDAAMVDLTLEPVGDRRARLIVTEVPARLLEIPCTPAFMDRGHSGGAPQMRVTAGPAPMAFA